MRLREIQVAPGGGAIPEVGNARRAWSERRGWLLRVVDTAGRIGWGEASPLPGYSPDSLDSARQALTRWAADAEDREIASVADVRAEVQRLPRAQPAARFAVETALLDLLGQGAGRSLAAVLAEGDIEVPATASALVDLDASSEAWRRAVGEGFATVKVKIGRAERFDDELRALGSLRRCLGPEIGIRLDANGTLPVDRITEHLGALAGIGPELVEEPVGRDAWFTLHEPAVPTALDETLSRLPWSRLEPHLDAARCVAVVLKPTVLGGSLACLDFARQARARGLDAIVSHTFDGPVALQAAAHLAHASRSTRAHGLARHRGLDAWPGADGLLVTGATVVVPRRPGLGVAPEAA